MSQSVLNRLTEERVVALLADADLWPRSRLSPTLIPDKWMGLLVRRDGGRQFVPAGEEPRGQPGDRLLLVRNRPITVPLAATDTRAACGHYVRGTCEILVRCQPRDDDLAALANTLLDSGELTLDGLARAVAEHGGQTAWHKLIRERAAAKLVHDDLSSDFLDELRAHLKRFLFSAGLTLERVVTLEFSSASLAAEEALQRQTAETVQRIKAKELVEQAALAATRRRLDDLAAILGKLTSAAARDDQSQWRGLLPALAPAERARLLENLWRITPDRRVAHAIVVVCGPECVWLAPTQPERVRHRVTLPDDLGGLRSVTFDGQHNVLLVGAARGVWLVAADDGQIRGRFAVPGTERPRTGFNAAVISRDRLYASHSQIGVWAWPLTAPEQPEPLFQPIRGIPRTIRAVTATDDGRLVFAADNTLRMVPPDAASCEIGPLAPDTLQCLCVLERTAYAGTSDGRVLQLDLDRPDGWIPVHRLIAPAAVGLHPEASENAPRTITPPGGATLESIVARRWNDLVELAIPAGADGICGIYVQERTALRLMEARVPIRRAWACDDLLVGLSDNRDRLVVLHASAGGRTGTEVPVARLLGRAIQDACIVTRETADDVSAAV